MSRESEDSDGAAVEHAHHATGHIGTTVAYALSESLGRPVDELNLELNDYVDPDALDRLFEPRLDGTPRKGGYLVLEIRGRHVEIHADGRITVQPE